MADDTNSDTPEPSDDSLTQEPVENDLSSEAENSTPEQQSLQGQDEPNPSDVEDSSDPSSHHNKDGESFHDNEQINPTINEDEIPVLLENLAEYREDVEDDLKWKEGLKLLTLNSVINSSYYDLWRDESNMIFRRSVILRKRYHKVAGKGGK
ncbi:MAG: hypothetical protein HRU19_25325 [Pseudobacteriovorax sp.]|nr:hypothetical protein [Pseudobacteriovorax sp.]